MYYNLNVIWVSTSLCAGNREQVLEAKQQAAKANASLQKALEHLEDYRIKLEASSSAVSSAKSSASTVTMMVKDSEDTGEFLNCLLKEHIFISAFTYRTNPQYTTHFCIYSVLIIALFY